ncbi:hypothetical protein [Prevotella sp.]|uniref:hypothetical protein n=1 Tax=Prevotella sp. TaxID=59823 RepID=UPI003FD82E87
MEIEMGIMGNIRTFVRNGVSALRSASSGKYNEESDIVREYRNELDERTSGRSLDMQNLMQDRRKVENDVRMSFKKIVLKTNK